MEYGGGHLAKMVGDELATTGLVLLVATAAGCAHGEATRLQISCCVGGDPQLSRCDDDLGASIALDGANAGFCKEWGGDGKVIAPGLHHVTARADTYCQPGDADVEVPPDQKTTVRLYLPQYPD